MRQRPSELCYDKTILTSTPGWNYEGNLKTIKLKYFLNKVKGKKKWKEQEKFRRSII
jgi:hypothetical protein